MLLLVMYLTRKMFRIGPGNLMCNACWLLDKTGFRIRRFFAGTSARAAPFLWPFAEYGLTSEFPRV